MPGGYVGGRAKDPDKLSKRPAQIRNRLRRKHKTFQQDLEIYQKVTGWKPVEEWDLEELARGRPRNPNTGRFHGKPPSWLTTDIIVEAKKRLMDEAFGSLSSHLHAAIETVKKLMLSEEVDDNGKPIVDAATKLKAAMFIIENIIGKPKAVVEIAAVDLTKQILAKAILLDDGQPQDEQIILEGEFEEVDDDDSESE